MKSTDIWNMSLAKGKTIVYEKKLLFKKKENQWFDNAYFNYFSYISQAVSSAASRLLTEPQHCCSQCSQ